MFQGSIALHMVYKHIICLRSTAVSTGPSAGEPDIQGGDP